MYYTFISTIFLLGYELRSELLFGGIGLLAEDPDFRGGGDAYGLKLCFYGLILINFYFLICLFVNLN